MAKNVFGGIWTEEKIDILMKYVKAYLTIMNNYDFKLLYFDGFAGSGEIESKDYNKFIEGVASKIINLDHPKKFDIYYLVEIKKKYVKSLQELFVKNKNVFIIEEDCNKKLNDLKQFLQKNPNYRALVFLDPFGLDIQWSSIENLKGLGIDLWLLFSTFGINRLLTTDTSRLNEQYVEKISSTLGISKEEILNEFYREDERISLFEETNELIKITKAQNKIIEIYKGRLKSVWKYVSTPHEMKNSKGSTLFHFICASDNKAGINIANDIIKNIKK